MPFDRAYTDYWIHMIVLKLLLFGARTNISLSRVKKMAGNNVIGYQTFVNIEGKNEIMLADECIASFNKFPNRLFTKNDRNLNKESDVDASNSPYLSINSL